MKHNKLVFSVLLLVFTLAGNAQRDRYFEIGITGGGTHFIGDVGNYGFHIPQGYYYGGFLKYNFNRHWAARAQFNYGIIGNDDALSGQAHRQNRNLNFSTKILELSALAEFNFLEFIPGTQMNHTPYLLGGIGVFQFNPTTELDGETVELRPLGTEGQNTSFNSGGFYALGSSFVQFGLGYKWAVHDWITIGIETTWRSTRTDYLDDVSGRYADPEILAAERGEMAATLSDRSLMDSDKEFTFRGNPQTDDWYVFTGMTLQFKFGELYEKCANFIR